MFASSAWAVQIFDVAVCLPAVGVDRDTDDAAGHLAHERLARGEERRMRSPVTERDAEPLRVAVHHVGAHLSRRREERQREQVGADRDEHAGVVRAPDERREVLHEAVLVRILQQRAEDARLERHRLHRPDVKVDVKRFGARTQHVDRLRQAAIADEEEAAFCRVRKDPAYPVRFSRAAVVSRCARAVQQRHRFGRRGRLVEQRRVGDLHSRQLRHHRLKVEEGFEAALRDLGLVRRVRCVPSGVLHHHPQDDARGDGVVIPEPDVGAERGIPPRESAEAAQVMVFALGWRQVQRSVQADGCRDRFVNQRLERRSADRLEHAVAVFTRRPNVAACEPVVGVESVHPRCD